MTGRGRSRGTIDPQAQPGGRVARIGAGRGVVQQTPLAQTPISAAAPQAQPASATNPQQSAPPSRGPIESRGRGRPAQSTAQQQSTSQQVSVPAAVPQAIPAYAVAQQQPTAASRGSIESRGRGRPAQPPAAQQLPEQQTQLEEEQSQEPAVTRGNGGGAADRGKVRGRNAIMDIVRTKPETVQSKRGSSGQPVSLVTNHFRLLKHPDWQLYQYRVDFSPLIELVGLRSRLIREQKETLGGFLFDGTMLFLSVKLPTEVTRFTSTDREGNPIETTVKFVNCLSMSTANSVQILNLILRRSMASLHLQLVGRNFFDALAKIDIPQHQLQLWPGYQTSIRQHEVDILLCAEITNKVMRTETVYDILQQCHQNHRGNWQIPFKEIVLGMTILAGYSNKTYRIDDVNFDLSPMSTFDTREGPVSYMEYYLKKYEIKIRDPGQPLLISKAKERDIRGGQSELLSLVPELCRATGLTDKMRSDTKLMSAVATYTRLPPNVRIEKLKAFNNRLQSTAESMTNLEEWNFRLDTNLVELTGRQLPNERIVFANNKTVVSNADADWSREFRNMAMFLSRPLKNWVLIVPTKKRREAEDFVGVLQRAGNGMRYEVGKPVIIEIADDRGQSYYSALDQALHNDPQLVMCIVTNNNADRYCMIKKKCCVERAIPSQVMLVKTITPKPGRDMNSLMSVGTKVVIQINSKLGGAPWMVEIPLSGLMVVGLDVCHDAKDKSKSYCALVASMDMKQAQNYFSSVSPHNNGEELSNEFVLNLVKALHCFKGQHKAYPDRIIIYRDGVGEGQTNYVYEHEVKNIILKLDEIYQGKRYKFAFIIVSKHINTRFFKGAMNPSPGTVVDEVVTLPERYDFFLISQCVRAGTVSPTSYNVLYDTSGLPPDRMQQFTYKMTHLYYNWSGTLGVPAVCQYAHKLAFLVGNCIHTTPSTILEKQLYFL